MAKRPGEFYTRTHNDEEGRCMCRGVVTSPA